MFQSQSPSLEREEEDDEFLIEIDESFLLTSTPNVAARCNVDGRNDEGDSTSTSFRIENSSSYDQDDKIKGLRKRVTLLQSFSMDHKDEGEDLQIDTLENHLFPDLSFCESEVFYEDSKFKTKKLSGDTTWNKLHGVSYSCKQVYSDSDEVDTRRSINHANRSLFRQKRRDWYLKRRDLNGQKRVVNNKIWWSYISKIFHIFFIMYKVIHRVIRITNRRIRITYGVSKRFARLINKHVFGPLFSILLLPWYIYRFIKRRITSFCSELFSSHDNVSDERRESRFSCLRKFCWVLVIVVALLLFCIAYIGERFQKVIPNPIACGIDNANSIYIDAENLDIPAWHIYPKQAKLSSVHPVKKTLKDSSPVIMFLRNKGNVDTPQLKSMYETLFSLGYHIIAPIDIISQVEILKTWKWIKAQTNATSYMWGFEINVTTLTETAKVFCKHLIPPNGVIIAKEIKSENIPQTVEIWSCNCALPSNGNSSTDYFKYNHVKCPVVFDNASNDVYSQVVACIETVNKSVDN